MIEYRELVALDIPALVGIERDVFPESPWSAAQFREELSGVPKTRRYLVAHEKGVIVGYAGIALAGDVADIHNIAVIPSYRKQGIASHLLDELESWAITRGVTALMLEIREGNSEAFPLYEKRGYKVISRRDNYYAPGIHALIMRKELTHE
jgi:ribosomal-protein-alanine N-acetyltransferase